RRFTLHEAGAALAFHQHPIPVRRLEVHELDLALEGPLDGGHAHLHDRLVLARPDLLESLAARDGLGERRRVQERCPDRVLRGGNLVRPLDLHESDSPRTDASMRRMPSRMVSSPVAYEMRI